MTNINEPLVSIITPCYNGETFLHRYFEGILAQTYKNIEVIFVNDGSIDKTEEIALSYGEKLKERGYKFIYIYQENAGQAAAINKGLKIFQGDYLTWPDSDDWMDSQCIKKEVEYLLQNQDIKIVLCKVAYVNEKKDILRYAERKNKQNGWIFEDLINVKDIYFAAGAYMVSSKEFLETNPERYIYEGKGGQNWQMILPICHKYKCGFIDEKLYNIFVRTNSHSRTKYNYEQAINRENDLETILIETINKIHMSIEEKIKYQENVKKIYIEKKFLVSYNFNKKSEIKSYYNQLLRYGKPCYRFRKKYFLSRHQVLRLIYKVFSSVSRIFIKILKRIKNVLIKGKQK